MHLVHDKYCWHALSNSSTGFPEKRFQIDAEPMRSVICADQWEYINQFENQPDAVLPDIMA